MGAEVFDDGAARSLVAHHRLAELLLPTPTTACKYAPPPIMVFAYGICLCCICWWHLLYLLMVFAVFAYGIGCICLWYLLLLSGTPPRSRPSPRRNSCSRTPPTLTSAWSCVWDAIHNIYWHQSNHTGFFHSPNPGAVSRLPERESASVCVWERERDCVCERDRARVCVWERERASVCVRERERERV